MTTKIATNQTSDALIIQWKAAKDSERQWTEYRRSLEAAILDQHKEDMEKITAWLEGKDTLTTSVELGDLVVTLGSQLDLDQTQAVLFLSNHPELAGVLFRCKYETANSRAFLKLFHGTNELSEAVKQTATIKPKKPGFALK